MPQIGKLINKLEGQSEINKPNLNSWRPCLVEVLSLGDFV